MTRILLAIPCFSLLDPKCVKSFYKIRVPEGFQLTIDYITGYGAAQARNKAANQAIDQNYDYLFFIDSDQIAPEDTLEKLLNCNTEISAGWAMQAINDPRTNISKFIAEKQFYDFYRISEIPNGIFNADAVGMACVLIKTEVFEKLKYPYFVYTEYEHKGILSEDLYFCMKAKEAGFKILCDTSLRLPHLKSLAI